MLSSLCCWLYLAIVGFNDSRFLIRLFVGRVNQHFENLNQDCACQTSRFFLVSSALGKTRHVRSGNSQLQLELLGTAHSLPGELRGAQPWNRLRLVWNMGLLVEHWAVEHLHVMAIWCLHRFLTTLFQSSNSESKFQTKPKSHISLPEMDIHRKHHFSDYYSTLWPSAMLGCYNLMALGSIIKFKGESKLETMPTHISWPEMDIHGKHH